MTHGKTNRPQDGRHKTRPTEYGNFCPFRPSRIWVPKLGFLGIRNLGPWDLIGIGNLGSLGILKFGDLGLFGLRGL